MNLKKVHHIAIIGSNYEQSKHFYVDLLGFSIIRENYRPERDDYKIDLQLDEMELEPVSYTHLVGLAYYYFVGCPTGACPLTSNPFITMAYMGFIGWLLSGIFGKGCSGSCNTQ